MKNPIIRSYGQIPMKNQKKPKKTKNQKTKKRKLMEILGKISVKKKIASISPLQEKFFLRQKKKETCYFYAFWASILFFDWPII
jgi:hypothetical protein